jgi:tyrosinase
VCSTPNSRFHTLADRTPFHPLWDRPSDSRNHRRGAACSHGRAAQATHGSVRRALFLPWHRAYLYLFERALQDLDAGANLPWWDWTTATAHRDGIPAGFRRTEARVNLNPLATGPVGLGPADLRRLRSDPGNRGALSEGAAPWTLRDPGEPDELPRPETIRRAMDARSFGDLSLLMEGIHASVHTWVGGAMTLISIAAYDPLFWAHHAMIDRLWYLWQMVSHERPPAELLDRALPPFPMTVRDTLDIRRLGYEYAVRVVG